MNKKHHAFTLIVVLASMLFITLFASGAPVQEISEHEFQVSPDDQLIVSVRDADIKIEGETGRNSVSIVITKTLKNVDEDKAQDIFDLYAFDCTQEDGLVRIESLPFDKSVYRQLKNYFKGLNIKIEVMVPEKSAILAKTSDGDISLSTIAGKVDLKTSDGDVSVGDITGPVNASTSDGDISLRQITGEVEIKTSDGDLSITDVDGNVQAKTSDGNVTVTNLTGNLDAKTSDGNIQASGVSGSLDLKTSDGNIDARLTQTPPSDCNLITSDGSISLSVTDDVSADLKIRVSDGDISFSHPSAQISKLNKHSVSARINEGGVMINLITSDGNIDVSN